MRPTILGFVLAALAANLPGQTVTQSTDKVLHFSQTDIQTGMRDLVFAIRALTDIPADLDLTQRTVTLHGTSAQIEMAEWLFVELDGATTQQGAPQGPVIAGTRLPGPKGVPEIVEILHFTNNPSAEQMRETVNAIRAIAELVRLVPVNGQKAVALRGAADRVRLGEWLFSELNQPSNQPSSGTQTAAAVEYRFPLSNDPGHNDVTRLFYLSPAQDLMQVVNHVRASTKIERMMPATAQHAIILRATNDQVAAAAQLIQQIESTPSGRKELAPRQ